MAIAAAMKMNDVLEEVDLEQAFQWTVSLERSFTTASLSNFTTVSLSRGWGPVEGSSRRNAKWFEQKKRENQLIPSGAMLEWELVQQTIARACRSLKIERSGR